MIHFGSKVAAKRFAPKICDSLCLISTTIVWSNSDYDLPSLTTNSLGTTVNVTIGHATRTSIRRWSIWQKG